MVKRWVMAWMVFGVFVGTWGCSSGKPPVKPNSVVAKQKLEAITKLADAMAKNPNGVDASVAFDEFNNLAYDPTTQPEESQAILHIYDKRIKGKYRGGIAQQLQLAVESFRLSFKGK
jgi:hypothetical protein